MSASRTRRRAGVLSLIRESGPGGITAGGLLRLLMEQNARVSLATVYRRLEDLTAEGLVVKNPGDGGPRGSRYVYAEREDAEIFYLKCTRCARFIPLRCAELRHFRDHVLSAHDFVLSAPGVVLTGVCGDCARRGSGDRA